MWRSETSKSGVGRMTPLSQMGKRMYQFEVTVYEVGEHDSYRAVLREGDRALNDPVVGLHGDIEPVGRESEGRHHRMMDQIGEICTRIAQELDAPLF